MNFLKYFFTGLLLSVVYLSFGQLADTSVTKKILATKDSIVRPKEKNPLFKETDSIKLKNPNFRDPKKAALRSAILPGWGQVYNKKIWKVPIVYAALGGTGYYFVYSLNWYKRTRQGYKVADAYIKNPTDTSGFASVNPFLIDLVKNKDLTTLKYYRDSYRRDVDYSAVYFMIAWILNVVDATVDAHLSTFDVNPNLTLQIQPGYSDMAKTNGISLVFHFK